MQRANADLISPGPVLSSCARVGTKKKKRPLPLLLKMTGGEYKVWQPPERAAGTKKKKESLFFSFSKRLFKMFVSKIIQDLHDYQSQPEKRLSYDGKIFFPQL